MAPALLSGGRDHIDHYGFFTSNLILRFTLHP